MIYVPLFILVDNVLNKLLNNWVNDSYLHENSQILRPDPSSNSNFEFEFGPFDYNLYQSVLK